MVNMRISPNASGNITRIPEWGSSDKWVGVRISPSPEIARIARAFNQSHNVARIGINACVQVELISETIEGYLLSIPAAARTENDWVLTERHINWDKGGQVMGATQILGTTAFQSHEELHRTMRNWLWSRPGVTDFGPSHCDQPKCPEALADDEWLREVMIPEWRRRFPVAKPRPMFPHPAKQMQESWS